MLLQILSYFSELTLQILLKSRNDLLKSIELILDCFVGVRDLLYNDSFNFLYLGPLIIELCLYTLLTPIDVGLNRIDHLFELFILLSQQGLLMSHRDQILLFGALDNIIHGHESFLDLLQETMLSAKRRFFILLQLFDDPSEFDFDVFFEVVFSTLSEKAIRINSLLNSVDQSLLVV